MKKILLYTIIGLLSSCVDLDQVPFSSMTPENFFKNEDDANSAVISAYAGFTNTTVFNQFSEVIHSQGTDDCEWGNGRNTNNADKNDFDKFAYTTESNLVYTIWSSYYTNINVCNYAIENIAAMPEESIPEEKRNNFIAEAKFLRAYFYFNLVRYWESAPLVTVQTTSLNNLKIPKNTKEELYQQIIEDLTFAEENLPSVNEYATADKGRATKGAASGMLAKVYLTLEDWQKVVEKTGEIIDEGEYRLNDKYADNFDLTKENGPESLFEIQYLAGEGNPGSIYNGYFRPSFVNIDGWTGYGDNPVTPNHRDAYGSNPDGTCDDQRRDVNTRLYTKAEYPNMSSTIIYPIYCNKYLDFTDIATRSNSGNNHPVLRYSDIYLMRAEALGRLNTSAPEAYEYLNKVRRRAYGFPIDSPASCDVSPVSSENEFIDLILHERRLEFAFEGQRWFDLVRTRKLKDAMMAQNPTLGSIVGDKHYVFPIPQNEIDANELLIQNDLWK